MSGDTDIVERLRNEARDWVAPHKRQELMSMAADEIERLRKAWGASIKERSELSRELSLIKSPRYSKARRNALSKQEG